MPTNWTWVCAECVEKYWVVLSTDKNIDDEKQTETQWAKNWSTPLWTIIEKRNCPCWLRFSWRSVHCVLRRGENTWSNFGRWAFHGTTCLSRCQILFFSTSDLWVKSVHTSPTKLQAALLSVWFCQSLTTAIAFCRDCPKNRLNVYRQCKMLLQELSWNAKKKKKKKGHITPILKQLHWLPIQKQICHKILSATCRSVNDNTPLYLSDLLQKHNPSRLLRSASRSHLDVPGPRDSKTKQYGQRSFRYVAPSLWNVLPESIKEKDSIQSFRPSLKTHFFT